MLIVGVSSTVSLSSAAASSIAFSISSSFGSLAVMLFCFLVAFFFAADGTIADDLVLFLLLTSEGIGSRVCPWSKEDVLGAL